MAMADFNRNNTFVIIMKNRADELSTKMIAMIKSFIVISLCLLILSIVSIFTIPNKIIPDVSILFIILNGYYSFNMMRSSSLKKVNDIIYGNAYSIIDVNNEDIFNVIENLDISITKANYVIQTGYIYMMFTVVLYVVLFIEGSIY